MNTLYMIYLCRFVDYLKGYILMVSLTVMMNIHVIQCTCTVVRCSVINHYDRRITLLSDTDISFGLIYLLILICLLGDSK